MKEIIRIILLQFWILLVSNSIFSQELCENHSLSRNFYSSTCVDDLKEACNNYIRKDGLDKCNLLVVDFKRSYDTTIVIIYKTCNLLELLYKHPDGYLLINNTIAFLQSPNYLNVNDSVWLQKVYNKARDFVPNSNIIIMSWKNNLFKKGTNLEASETNRPDGFYDSLVIKYIFIKSNLIEISESENYLYENWNVPKDIDKPWTW